MTGILEGKSALVFGVANRRSIAWAIAQALAGAGASLAFTFQGERIEAGVRELAGSVNSSLVLPCDVTRDEDLDSVFETVGKEFDGLDILVDSVAEPLSEVVGGALGAAGGLVGEQPVTSRIGVRRRAGSVGVAGRSIHH